MNPTTDIANKSSDFVEHLKANSLIDKNCYRGALLQPEKTKISVFYHLPKVHKNKHNPPGRPIISGCGGPTEKLSKLVDHWLQPLVPDQPSYVKDSTHFLQLVEQWNDSCSPLPQEALIVSIDVAGLYTDIPHQEVVMSVTDIYPTKKYLCL